MALRKRDHAADILLSAGILAFLIILYKAFVFLANAEGLY
jgi:hypothetical protein